MNFAMLWPIESWLERFGIDEFDHIELAPWLVVAVLGWLLLSAFSQRRAIAWPGLIEARVAGARSFEAIPIAGRFLRGAAALALLFACLGPAGVHRAPPAPGLGLDLVLVLDTSGSMRALDTVVEGRPRTRLALAREVVSRFAKRRVAEGDRVGLVVFGSSAFTQCPITSDGDLLSDALARVEVGMAGEATALGDALALALKRATAGSGGSGQVIVLLTDGRSNEGDIPVSVALELARSSGVRVHTVGIGTGGEEVPMAVKPGSPGSGLRFERHDPDLETLRRIASVAGGRFFPARRSGDLESVYNEIDAIERAPRPLPPRVERIPRAEPLLALAGGLLLLEILAVRIWRRRLP